VLESQSTKQNASLSTPAELLKGKGQTVVGWTEGCSTTVVQQLEMPDRRDECMYVE